MFAAALVAGGAALTSGGCSGSTEQTLTPAGDGEAVEVDVDRDPNTGGVGVDVDVDGARNEPGRDPIEINVRGSDDAQTAPERRQERRERIGEALDNLNVDVNTDDVQVDVD